MDKRKLLIVDKSFAVGGIQTSLLNMLDAIKGYYDIDLLMYYAEGPLKERLPDGVNLINTTWRLESCGMSFSQCMKVGSFKQKVFRILATIWTKVFDNRVPLYIAIKHQNHLGHYDAAIAYHHEAEKKTLTSGFIRVIDKCCDTSLKLSWIHNDSASNDIDEKFNDRYYRKANRIVAVSDAVKRSFSTKHFELAERTTSFYNFLNYGEIRNYSKKECEKHYFEHSLICFSACRLEKVKGLPRAICAIAETLRNNDIIWLIAGDGNDKSNIEQVIKKEELSKKVILLGAQDNPYCYMSRSDIVMLMSYHEAAPMVYLEAQYLGVPVFTTELASSREMLDKNKAIICENSENGIVESFGWIVDNMDIVKSMKVKALENEKNIIAEKISLFNELLRVVEEKNAIK